MEIELSRHDWLELRCFAASAAGLRDAVRDLVYADSREAASAAVARINNVTIVQGRLSQSSVAVAACLVQGLSVAVGPAREAIVDLLAEISGGYDDHVDLALVGPISYQDCIQEISLAFPVYCELVELGNPSAIDLVLMCGLNVLGLRARAEFVLAAASGIQGLGQHRDLLLDSLQDLRSQPDSPADS